MLERPHAHTIRFSMAARANVACDRLLAAVLCVLATCSSRGDSVVRKEIVLGSARERLELSERDERGNEGERGARVLGYLCGRLVELEREADEMGRAAHGVYVA